MDHSAEADTLKRAPPSTALTDANDFLYLGKDTRFKEVYANLAVTGSYTGLVWEYWDGDEWKALVSLRSRGRSGGRRSNHLTPRQTGPRPR